MTDMDKMTMRDYAKRCGVTYECVRRTVNKELKNNPVFEKYVHKLGRTTYLDSRAVEYLLACKIFNRDLTNIEIILAKCSYAEFAFLVLLYPMCIEKKSKEKGTYTTNLTVGTIALFLELGLILFSLH